MNMLEDVVVKGRSHDNYLMKVILIILIIFGIATQIL